MSALHTVTVPLDNLENDLELGPVQLRLREPTQLDAATLRSIRERGAVIHIVVNNELRFIGTDAELSAQAFDEDRLAGEHPLEYMVRVLTTTELDEPRQAT